MKKIIILFMCLGLITGCSVFEKKSDEVTVTFYGWSGDVKVNAWLDGYVKKTLKEEYNINFVRVGMDISDIIMMLSNEKSVGKAEGDIDLIWINGVNFSNARDYDILQKIDVEKLSNYSYIDPELPYLYDDFGMEIEDYEIPIGVAQFVFVANTSVIEQFDSAEELLEVAKNNPGKITYPASSDFTGSAFIRNICYEIVGYDKINEAKSKEELRKVLEPAFEYLNELEQYLWQEGETYPKEEAIMQQMYADSQLGLTMSYTALLGPRNVQDGTFPSTSESFVFNNGNLGNAHYLAIPYNSKNVEGAHNVIDFILSSQSQASKSSITGWGDLPILSYDLLTSNDKEIFDEVNKALEGQIDIENVTKNSLPEVTGNKTTMINELWEEEVLNK